MPTFNATAFGAPCVQPGVSHSYLRETWGTLRAFDQVDGVSEDCLTLNVYRPSGTLLSSDTLVPVLLWIYGGSFISGATAAYPANNIIARSVLRVGFCFSQPAALVLVLVRG